MVNNYIHMVNNNGINEKFPDFTKNVILNQTCDGKSVLD